MSGTNQRTNGDTAPKTRYIVRMTQAHAGPRIPEWTIADRLRKAREHANLEQADLAGDLGVSRNTISNYERGKVDPRRAVLLAWAMRTGVDVAWILSGEEPRPEDPDGAPWYTAWDSNPEPADSTTPQVTRLRRTRSHPLRRAG